MAARSISSATVSFGMVAIPVKLYSATEASAGVSFNLLHGKCGTRLKQQYTCPTDNEVVTRDEMVKGYEFTKGRYVTFTEAELKALQEKATQTIDIVEFVPLDKIDPVYFEKSYYLGPDKGGAKPYHLLAAALEETGLAALAQYAARGKGYLVMLRPVNKRLVMQQLLRRRDSAFFRGASRRRPGEGAGAWARGPAHPAGRREGLQAGGLPRRGAAAGASRSSRGRWRERRYPSPQPRPAAARSST